MAEQGIHFLDARGPANKVIYAIGDVHGRLDLLRRMHAEIAADRQRRKASDWAVIHLGDYVDRGPDSMGVLDFLVEATEADPRVVALAGNHDVGLLAFLAEPDPNSLFARYGGRETAASYGVALDLSNDDSVQASRRQLVAAMPRRHVEFLLDLQFSASFGDFFFCHAGIRPGVALVDQTPQDLTWVREPFLRFAGLHPKVIVHGHTPAPQAEVMNNRVNVDTGAFASGKLSALVIDGADKQILEVSGSPG